MSHPGTLTIVIPVQLGHEIALDAYLVKSGTDKRSRLMRGLASLGTIHFARWVLIPAIAPYGALLAFESNHDGTAEQHLTDLVVQLGPDLDEMLRHCVGFDEEPQPTYAYRRAFLERHVNKHVSPYRGHPNLSARLIQNDVALKRALSDFVDTERRRGGLAGTPAEVHAAVKAYAKSHLKHLDTAPHPRELPSVMGFYARIGLLGVAIVAAATIALRSAFALGGWGTVGAVGVSILALGLVVFGVYYGFRAFVSAVEKEEEKSADAEREKVMREADRRMREIFYSEDRQTQNALTHLVPVKDDLRRRFILSVMLFAIRLLGRMLYVHGKLGSIDSIHCARWIRIDGGKRLLFFSNYDGSWESYLGEFVDKLAFWLTAVWSNTQGFPTTKNMFNDGAEDEEWFKRWTRSHQLFTHVWYAAYPNTSVQNVIANARLREGLSQKLTDQELRAWLRLL